MPPIDPAALLAGAEAARTQPEQSAEVIARALRAAPQDAELRLAAYRFYFYTHNHAAALEQAEELLRHAARRLNVAPDWRDVAPEDAAFGAQDFAPGLYMQALVAIGYCAARTGALAEARAVLGKAAELDPSDRFGGAWLLARLDAVEDEEA
ncbi:hypothetical protein M4578_06425 [Salipiger sp. P9]|uniref:hypothetical protein n=1 Tax=Salipiger pentaromativorans TaxID=2943193 RepID=UPI00215808E5|nr:hypothetical protein [Salipiger pentaromativorans]MCR8547456.1 hypothetical protein [Salipiger pentaromativorans]